MKKPELLSPAGSFEAATAAVSAGADAIYVGGRMLNARMNAKNLTDAELEKCAELCRKHGVRFYVTVNTAVYDKELKSAVEYIDMLYKIGTDALIISDLGLVSLIKDRYPNMELHASTQASGHNIECAEAFAKAGFSRMVCARELSKNEINELCKGSPIEIEQFVHGAMCVSQSGQCLASAVMGGRSGNRGVCAQPCRMKYNGKYPLSLKDMCLAGHITEILQSGVASLKLEGRMKSPTYVYGVTSVYRRLIDETRNASNAEIKQLSELFSRSGFTDGYYVGKTDGSMLGIRDEKDKSASSRIQMKFKPLNRHLPPIILNERTPNGEISLIRPPKRASGGKPIQSARFSDARQICGNDMFSHIYLPLEKYEKDVCDGVIFPPSVFGTQNEKFLCDLERAVALGATEALVCHLGQIELAIRYGLNVRGDYRLNVFNSSTARFYIEKGLKEVILSPELTLPQIRDINAPKSTIVYGRFPIMLLTKPVETDKLVDGHGAHFPVIKENGRDILLNSVPIYTADKQNELDMYGIKSRHFIFTTESPIECKKILNAYKNGLSPDKPVRRLPK